MIIYQNPKLIYDDISKMSLDTGADINTLYNNLNNDCYIECKTDDSFQELSHLAAKAMLPEKLVLATARETVESFLQVWAEDKNHLDVDKATINTISKHLQGIPVVTA